MTNKTPTHHAFIVRNFRAASGEEKSHWTQVGSVWTHSDGNGFDMTLAAFPVDGRLVIRVDERAMIERRNAEEREAALALLRDLDPNSSVQAELDEEDDEFSHTPCLGPVTEAIDLLWPANERDSYPSTFGELLKIIDPSR